MLLFEGSFGRILHCGDFRWESDYQLQYLQHPVLSIAAVDIVYLDNTYAHPRFSSALHTSAILQKHFSCIVIRTNYHTAYIILQFKSSIVHML